MTTRHRKIYVATLLLLTLAAYGLRHWLNLGGYLSSEDKGLIARSCAGESLVASRPLLAGDIVDKRIAERYGAACRSLTLDPHLHFGRGLNTYQCRIWIPRQAVSAEDRQALTLIETLFGHRSFDLMTYERKAGTEATVLLVTDDGEDVAAIADQQSLRMGLQQVRDVQGAVELIGLLNDTGRLTGPPSLCSLNVASDKGGWTLSDVKIPENCAPPWWRIYRVERSGAVQMQTSNKRWWRFDTVLCND